MGFLNNNKNTNLLINTDIINLRMDNIFLKLEKDINEFKDGIDLF
jgi:hypothetical protein